MLETQRKPQQHDLTFTLELAGFVAQGCKNRTWRINNERDIKPDDRLRLLVRVAEDDNTKRLFGLATVKDVYVKKLGDLGTSDFIGHEPFSSQEELIDTYRKYYGPGVGEDSLTTIITFAPHLLCNKPGSDETDVIITNAWSRT